MPWFKLDDSFHQHPKVVVAGNAAVGLWIRCATYSAQYLTDGYIPNHIVHSYGKAREVGSLVDVHLWVPTDGGMLIPDYLDYNPSKADVDLARKRDAERKRRGRESRHE